jgi:stage II sporulation protein GA (sporulation sigma-E factor processing peptidase)
VSQDLTASIVYFWPGRRLSFLAAWLACRTGAQILFKRFQRLHLQVLLKIYLAGTEVELTGLIDTGNSLKDPLTGNPVIIVEYKALSKALPEKMKKLFESGFTANKFNVRELETNSWATRLRLIPYRSLGQNNGFLIGLKPDRVEVYREGKMIVIEKVIIGIYLNSLNSGQVYQALLHPNLLAVA